MHWFACVCTGACRYLSGDDSSFSRYRQQSPVHRYVPLKHMNVEPNNDVVEHMNVEPNNDVVEHMNVETNKEVWDMRILPRHYLK